MQTSITPQCCENRTSFALQFDSLSAADGGTRLMKSSNTLLLGLTRRNRLADQTRSSLAISTEAGADQWW